MCKTELRVDALRSPKEAFRALLVFVPMGNIWDVN
jgi:hypothetical protein